MTWVEPVFDRTLEDVEEARRVLAAGGTLENLKGCLNFTDLNRIEGDMAYLFGELQEIGKRIEGITREWSETDIPLMDDIRRILINLDRLTEAFILPEDVPFVPERILRYNEVNDIEQLLYIIHEILLLVKASFRKSGTFQSGGKRMFLLRR